MVNSSNNLDVYTNVQDSFLLSPSYVSQYNHLPFLSGNNDDSDDDGDVDDNDDDDDGIGKS